MSANEHHKTRMLWLATALHAFTHIYHVALMPLYLPIQQDFQLASVGKATLLVTVMMVGYFVPSYPMGMLADRVNRKKLLGLGLAINALAFIGLSMAPNYPSALLCVALAGFGGSFYHPAATAMVARLYPIGTGKALGVVGIGASVGFFIGPIYTGWRAGGLEAALGPAAWRQPVLELGALGIVGALLFIWLADEESTAPAKPTEAMAHPEKMFPTPALWLFFVAACLAFGLRDFTGNSMGSLGSLFLQRAHGYTLKETGLALSGIFLASAISNPLFGSLSDRGRMRWTCLVLCVAGIMVAIVPHMPPALLVPAFVVYGFFFMSNYPMVEAALMESVPDAVRGRVFGFFITLSGLIGNVSHWLVGRWVQTMGNAASSPASYFTAYGVLAALILLSLLGLPCLHAIRKREHLEGETPVLTAAITGGQPANRR